MNVACSARILRAIPISERRLVLAVAIGASLFAGTPARAGGRRPVVAKKVVKRAHVPPHRVAKHAPSAAPAAGGPAAIPAGAGAAAAASAVPVVSAAPAAPAQAPAWAQSAASRESLAVATTTLDQQVFTLINQTREAYGLSPLVLDAQLTEAAQIQANATALLDDLSHDLPSMPQPTFESRLQYVGYNYLWAAENLASGAFDAPSVVALWMNSPPHEANILSPNPVATGVAVAYDSQGVPYYCQVFGDPQ